METFNINVDGTVLEGHPLENESFDVYHNNLVLANVHPDITDCYVHWQSVDEIQAEYVAKIGKAIECYYS